jgi:hypothetical protein
MPTSVTSVTNENAAFRKCCFTQHDPDEPAFSKKLAYLGYAKETCPSFEQYFSLAAKSLRICSMWAPGKSFFHPVSLIT